MSGPQRAKAVADYALFDWIATPAPDVTTPEMTSRASRLLERFASACEVYPDLTGQERQARIEAARQSLRGR